MSGYKTFSVTLHEFHEKKKKKKTFVESSPDANRLSIVSLGGLLHCGFHRGCCVPPKKKFTNVNRGRSSGRPDDRTHLLTFVKLKVTEKSHFLQIQEDHRLTTFRLKA